MSNIKLKSLKSLIEVIVILFFLSQIAFSQVNTDFYAEQECIADFIKFKIGDFLPEKYQAPEYAVQQWQLRNLPAPKNGTRWVYIGESYILIDSIDGKICKIYNRDIFYNY